MRGLLVNVCGWKVQTVISVGGALDVGNRFGVELQIWGAVNECRMAKSVISGRGSLVCEQGSSSKLHPLMGS